MNKFQTQLHKPIKNIISNQTTFLKDFQTFKFKITPMLQNSKAKRASSIEDQEGLIFSLLF